MWSSQSGAADLETQASVVAEAAGAPGAESFALEASPLGRLDIKAAAPQESVLTPVQEDAAAVLNIEIKLSRTMSASLALVPQQIRGITLAELLEFVASEEWEVLPPSEAYEQEHRNKWLAGFRWRCNACKRSCHCAVCPLRDHHRPPNHGACGHYGCDGTMGMHQMRNLYEVTAEVIKPVCQRENISYVEHLSGRRLIKGGVAIRTFVSHWWGEEFIKLVKSLKRYARVQAAASFTRAAPSNWSFWICAFANNQFEIQHAMGVDGDVMASAFAMALKAPSCSGVACVIDEHGEIYRRIWCAFELFCVKIVIPRDCGRYLEIALVNETGVLSQGDTTSNVMKTVDHLMTNVHCADAEATVSADREMILECMQKEGVTFEDLDDVLRQLVQRGRQAVGGRRYGPIVIAFSFPYLGFLPKLFSVRVGTRDYLPWDMSCFLALLLPSLCFLSYLSFSAHCGSGGCRDRRSWLHFRRIVSSAFVLQIPLWVAWSLALWADVPSVWVSFLYLLTATMMVLKVSCGFAYCLCRDSIGSHLRQRVDDYWFVQA